MKNEIVFGLCVIVLALGMVIGAKLRDSIDNNIWRATAIDHGVGGYNPTNGQFGLFYSTNLNK